VQSAKCKAQNAKREAQKYKVAKAQAAKSAKRKRKAQNAKREAQKYKAHKRKAQTRKAKARNEK